MYPSSNSSSSSSSDSGFDEMFTRVREWNKSIHERRQNEEAVVRSFIPLISSTIERPLPTTQRRYVRREREQGHNILYEQYFAENTSFPVEMFRRRYRMRRHVFCRIMEALHASDDYFHQKPDACGRLGLTIEQKCTAAMRILAYGMMGSIDCMHWTWKNCPRSWRGQFQGRNKTPTLILEAVASRDLWIWHAFFGTPGSCNDINVLDRSPVFTDILEGQAPSVNYMVNNHSYNMGYYLTDGIYPKWGAFIQSITAPQTAKHKLFAKKQESVRKDVERSFGVLQARFAIIRQPALAWSRDVLGKIMLACIILHNMIVEDERPTYKHFDPRDYEDVSPQNQASSSRESEGFTFSNVREYNLSSYMSNRNRVRDTSIHKTLKTDLIENIWEKFQEEIDDN